MANDNPSARRAGETPEAAEATSRSPGKAGGLRQFFFLKWLAVVLLVSVAVHGAGFAYYRLREQPAVVPLNPEVSLGAFHFEADAAEGGRTAKADFSLHVALIEPVEQTARQRLEAKKYRVQQEVEELVRKAHSGDFDDPGLRDLKRQLLEQVNQTLGMRAVSEIMITDLKIHRDGHVKTPATVAAEPRPAEAPVSMEHAE